MHFWKYDAWLGSVVEYDGNEIRELAIETDDADIADMQVMAAGMDLLAACEAYIQTRKSFIRADGNRMSDADLTTMIGAAIAKAKGRP